MMTEQINRQDVFTLKNGAKAPLPFSEQEYKRRLGSLRDIMSRHDLPAVVLTSMHNIAYYSGFLYCSFGRPFGCAALPSRLRRVATALPTPSPPVTVRRSALVPRPPGPAPSARRPE